MNKESAINLLRGSVLGTNEQLHEAVFMAIKALKAKPIVQCKDCKYMTEHYDTDGNAPYWTCSEWDSGTDYDGYCHHGERRER